MNNLDYDKLAADIGAPNGQAARKRWGRLFDKLSGSASKTATPRSASKPTGVKKNVKAKTPLAKKVGNGKKGKVVKDEEDMEDGEETPSDEPDTTP